MANRRSMALARVAVSIVALATAHCGGCMKSTLYPKGYMPHLWIVVVDGDDFLAWPVHTPSVEHSGGRAARRVVGAAPEGTQWVPVSRIERFEREQWRSEGTMVVLAPLKGEIDPLITGLLEERGIFYMPTAALLSMKRTPQIEDLLESLPPK